MPATERQKAYAKGYWKGSQGAWPDHRPPFPPDEVLGPIIRVADYLRARVADKIVVEIGAGIGLLACHVAMDARRVYGIEVDPG